MTIQQYNILHHTIHKASVGLYCGTNDEVMGLVGMGFMEYAGKDSIGGKQATYWRVTAAGKQAAKDFMGTAPQAAAKVLQASV